MYLCSITGFTVGNTYGLSIYVTNYGTHTAEFTPTSATTYSKTYTLYPYSYYPDFEEPIDSFIDPDPGENQHFGWRARSGRDYHTGVDIAMDANGNSYEYMNPRPNVYSVCDGTINQVLYNDDSLGNTVQVLYSDGSHNYYVTYAHLNSISCGSSGSISEGNQIGVVGKSGDVTAAHLHISTSTSSVFTKTPGSWIDPAAFGIY